MVIDFDETWSRHWPKGVLGFDFYGTPLKNALFPRYGPILEIFGKNGIFGSPYLKTALTDFDETWSRHWPIGPLRFDFYDTPQKSAPFSSYGPI